MASASSISHLPWKGHKSEMSRQPKLSVLITSYNREKYIGQAIESVLAQTFSDFELLIVDDCSSDNTVSVARSYENDARVRVVVNEHNLGDYPNRNHAATYARGSFLKYHDSDDIMYPYCLEVMMKALELEPRAGFALSTNERWPGGPCPMFSTPRQSFQREFLGWGGLFWGIMPAHALFRADAFRALKGFPEAGPHSDVLCWLRACAKVNVLLVQGDLFWPRSHEGQGPVTAFDRVPIYEEIWRTLNGPDCPLTANELLRARRNWCYWMLKQIVFSSVHGRWRLAFRIVRSSGISLSDWARYLRRGHRSGLAGTPFDENGEYIVPELLLPKSPAAEPCQSKTSGNMAARMEGPVL
jgi:glycosyltransferase involved in cell wall biosynthesis